MSVIDNLIFDRTQADVDRVFELKNKILTGGGLSALTSEEQTEYMAGMKGAYNYTDFNRIGEAISYLVERMKALAIYDDSIIPKVDWAVGDWPTQSQISNLLTCLTKLRAKLNLPANAPSVPGSMDYMTYQLANDIEQLLFMIDSRVTQTTAPFPYTGVRYCGQ
ncbi:hypothetical protein [Dysosmobacter welbionis]|jgi:hypothetical protein|uniref:Uncharacterized protein n=1 Tax=Siphoviridae sp. ctZD11 TaxID=2825556 RepID=A0A8S5U538_9CAUD|nr:MAG TPA: hypothetical protein [Siphoviridae sp. ctZD11]DAH48684.1 MAG TPA: hypothetical protein [Caudoviricetes sp.]